MQHCIKGGVDTRMCRMSAAFKRNTWTDQKSSIGISQVSAPVSMLTIPPRQLTSISVSCRLYVYPIHHTCSDGMGDPTLKYRKHVWARLIKIMDNGFSKQQASIFNSCSARWPGQRAHAQYYVANVQKVCHAAYFSFVARPILCRDETLLLIRCSN